MTVITEKTITTIAFLILSACGMLVFVINKTKINYDQLGDKLTIGFWGFQPTSTRLSITKSNVWSFRKLILAGCMFCCVLVIMTIKQFGSKISVVTAAIVFVLWIVVLHGFWIYVVDSKENTSNKPNLKPQKGWENKIKLDLTTDSRLPVTIVTGFLGSVGMKILVVENEVGEVGVDHELLLTEERKEEIVLMNNGCICCSVRKDLIAMFHKFFQLNKLATLDWVVIETTGLADPAPVIQALYMDEECKRHLRIDSVLTVVDSKHLPMHLDKQAQLNEQYGSGEPPPGLERTTITAHGARILEAVQQLAYADRIVLNKTDLVSKEELASLELRVRAINPQAAVVRAVQAQVDIAQMLNVNSFSNFHLNANLVQLLSSSGSGEDSSQSQFQFPMVVGPDGQVSRRAKNTFSSSSSSSKPLPLHRAQGQARDGGIFQGGRSRISTVTLTSKEPLVLSAFNLWIARLLKEHGPQLYRHKGILCFEGYDEKFIAQGIHMIFNGELGGSWGGDQDRSSRFVVIGLDLDHALLREGFGSCTLSATQKKNSLAANT